MGGGSDEDLTLEKQRSLGLRGGGGEREAG